MLLSKTIMSENVGVQNVQVPKRGTVINVTIRENIIAQNNQTSKIHV